MRCMLLRADESPIRVMSRYEWCESDSERRLNAVFFSSLKRNRYLFQAFYKLLTMFNDLDSFAQIRKYQVQ